MSSTLKMSDILSLLALLSTIVIAVFSSDYFLAASPSLSIIPDFNSIEIENHGEGSARILKINFIKDAKPYCLNQENIEKFAGMDFLKYKINISMLEGNIEIASGDKIQLISCILCKESDYNPLLKEIKINIEYKGTGILNTKNSLCDKKTTCGGNDFEKDDNSC